MKVSVEASKCIGCGLCVNSCPDVFELTDDGIAVVKSDADLSSTECDLKDMASQCPVEAIIVEG